jgi:hypothetical protein
MILCGLSLAACSSGDRHPTEPRLAASLDVVAPADEDTHELADIDRQGIGDRGNQSATGHGNLTSGGELRTFSFTAVRLKDGTVTGQWQLQNRSGVGSIIHGEVTCLLAIARPTQGAAFMGGVVTHVEGVAVGFFPGRPVAFSAFDNGEGMNERPDEITLVEATNETVVERQCRLGLRVGGGARPIEDGNIQVRP